MFDVWIDEDELAPGLNDTNKLIDWMLTSLTLIRRRAVSQTEIGKSPVARLMRDYVLTHSQQSLDPRTLLSNLDISSTTLHHLLGRLRAARLVTPSGGADSGHRLHRLRFGKLSMAVRVMGEEGRTILHHNLIELFEGYHQPRVDNSTFIDEKTLFSIRIRDPSPPKNKPIETLVSDLGLSGERPGTDGKAEFEMSLIIKKLMEQKMGLTIHEGCAITGKSRARVTRQLLRLQQAGIVQRSTRMDLLTDSLMNIMKRQIRRRGRKWLEDGRRLGRLGKEKCDNLILAAEENNNSALETHIKTSAPGEKGLVLLNVLGGNLPDGWRLVGSNAEEISKKVCRKFDRFVSRLQRVSEKITNDLELEE